MRAMQVPDFEKAMTFWGMINYALWKRIVIDGESVDELLAELAESERKVSGNE